MKKQSSIDEFIALPDSEKKRIVDEIEAETPEERLAKSRPLNARERAMWVAFQRNAARPKPGKKGCREDFHQSRTLAAERGGSLRKEAQAEQIRIVQAWTTAFDSLCELSPNLLEK